MCRRRSTPVEVAVAVGVLVAVGVAVGVLVGVGVLLVVYGLSIGCGTLSVLRRYAMACPALPTCGLAVAESERYLPDLIGELERRGYGDERVWVRMSGCPNACSHPPTAEIGLVGRSLGLYNLYVGGSFEGTQLARLYRADVRADVLAGAPTSGGMAAQAGASPRSR